MGYTDCSGYVSQALSLGVSPAEIEAFKAANTNSDGTWDCHRLLDAFGGAREQATAPTSPVVQAIAQATPLAPPVMVQGTTGADARMFMTMENVPTSIGGGAPNRQLAPYMSSSMTGGVGSGLFSGGSVAGFDLKTLLILAAIAIGGWYLYKKG